MGVLMAVRGIDSLRVPIDCIKIYTQQVVVERLRKHNVSGYVGIVTEKAPRKEMHALEETRDIGLFFSNADSAR